MSTKTLIAFFILCALAASAADQKARPINVPPVSPTPSVAGPMSKLNFLRGIWAGTATGTNRDGSRYSTAQTERVGPMLGGDILVIEGRGYKEDNSTSINAFAVISWNPQMEKYEFRSYAQGHAGTFELKLTSDGFVWELPAGPDSVIRFTATVKNGNWHQIGEYVAPGKPAIKNFAMDLKRWGDTDWPLGTPVSPSRG